MDMTVKAPAAGGAYQTAKSGSWQAVDAPAGKDNPVRTDRLELSSQRTGQDDPQQLLRAQREQIRSEVAARMEEAKMQAEARAAAAKMQLLCLKIAMRLLAGDKVPPQDEEYLLEHDPGLYTVVINCRAQKEDPEEHNSLLEEEGEQSVAEGAVAAASEGMEAAVQAVTTAAEEASST